MDDNTVKLMEEIDKVISRLEIQIYENFENKDLLESECKKILGYNTHFLWHINFNSYKFKDIDDFFTMHNMFRVKSFDEFVKNIFNKLTKDKKIDPEILFLTYNKYLIYKEKGLI